MWVCLIFKMKSKNGGIFLTRRKTNEEFLNEVYEIVNEEYTFLEPYIKSGVKIKVRHNSNNCNYYEYSVTPNKFLLGRRCPRCKAINTSNRLLDTHSKYEEKFRKSDKDNEYSLLSQYISSHERVTVQHKICGYKYEVTACRFIAGDRCRKCFGTKKRTQKEAYDDIIKATNGECEMVGEYINTNTRVDILHKKCGRISSLIPKEILSRNSRCLYCNWSRGEVLIEEFLIKEGIEYEPQLKTFKNPKTNHFLRYDFGIFNKGKIIGIIEYDGAQHFNPIGKTKEAKINFDETVFRDNLKNEWAENNNIPMLRVPYYKDSELEKLLKNFILKIKC